MCNKGKINGVNFWLPEETEIGGNVHCRWPGSNEIRRNIHRQLGIVDALEPDYYTGGTILNITDINIAKMIAYEMPTCVKCNGIVASRAFLKENKFGMYGRSSDCLMCAIISDESVWMLHISAEALNNGIMLGLPNMPHNTYAILGPCISKANYFLPEEILKERCFNYPTLGYDKYCSTSDDGDKTHIDIKGIVLEELQKRNIQIAYNDERCTLDSQELGSHRRENNRANPLYIWL